MTGLKRIIQRERADAGKKIDDGKNNIPEQWGLFYHIGMVWYSGMVPGATCTFQLVVSKTYIYVFLIFCPTFRSTHMHKKERNDDDDGAPPRNMRSTTQKNNRRAELEGVVVCVFFCSLTPGS